MMEIFMEHAECWGKKEEILHSFNNYTMQR
jgi:hypothetical protein